jgi:hypothetical protein
MGEYPKPEIPMCKVAYRHLEGVDVVNGTADFCPLPPADRDENEWLRERIREFAVENTELLKKLHADKPRRPEG